MAKIKEEKSNQRIVLSTLKLETLPPLDLVAIQVDSYQWFLTEGIKELLEEISPIEDFTGKNWLLILNNHRFGRPKYTTKEALIKGVTFDLPLRAQATLTNKRSGKTIKQEVFLGDIPAMTERGTFIINGIERAVVNQLVRSPGVFFTGQIDPITGRTLYQAEIRPLYGSWLEFNITRQDVITVRIDRRRKFPATLFLRCLGLGSDEQIVSAFKDLVFDSQHYLEKTMEKDPATSQEEAVLEMYKKIRPGEPIVLENASELLKNMFFNPRRYNLGRVGRYKINKKLALDVENKKENWVLTDQDVVATIAYLINLAQGKGSVDDIDHLANRRVRRVGELVATTSLRIGLLRLERVVKERMSLGGANADFTPAMLVNARPVIAAINDFFRTSQLSTVLDQTNPLSELDNLRRLTVMGAGGISRERASFSIRDINSSQYGRICPVRSPEGPNIGLVTYMALYARVNEYGFLETPYRKVEKVKRKTTIKSKISDKIEYLASDDEEKFYITHAGIKTTENNYIIPQRVPVRFRGEFLEADASLVDYIDVVPRQVVGIAASLIPFIAHDEANRALMGTHMQCQAAPLLRTDAPIVGTGMESVIPEVLGWVVKAKNEGEVVSVDAQKVVVKTKNGQDVYLIEKFKRTAQNTCFSQRPLVKEGQKVKKNQVIIDGPSSDQGELALGQNLTIAYMSFEGLGYEDAIVISDRLVKQDVLTSIHIEEYEAAVVDTKLGPEETTRDIPNVGEEALANLDEEGIVVIGAEVGPNAILAGKIAPKGETELTAEERLLRAIFGEKAREVRDTSLRMPHGERGTVIDVQIFDREKGDELEPGTNKKIVVKVAQIRKVVVGDKLAGRHGNKGVISKIVPEYDMPYLEDGTPIDIIISPLSVLARMNLGQLLEAHLGWAADKLNYQVAVPVFEEVPEEKIIVELKRANLPLDGKTVLFDGRTGEPFEKRVVVGKAYIMKLIHMVEDKTHARSTGPYSLVTQQPLGGKAQMGGQRLGEMEVWTLEAHKAAYTLQEMLTIKSDDVVGRARAFEALVKGTDIPTPTIPESFKVLAKELQALAIDLIPTGVITSDQLKLDKEDTDIQKKESSEKDQLFMDKRTNFSNIVDFSGLKIQLASYQTIELWSHGEVTKPETINYRTLRPEKDGLFDERIFGPTRDWECYCGKYKRIRYRGIICDKCGVEVTQSRVRRERMGHISLSAPVVHVWFFKGAPSKLSLLLNMTPKALESVIYFTSYLVIEVDEEKKEKALKHLSKLDEEKKKQLEEKFKELIAEVEKNFQKEKKQLKERFKDEEARELAAAELDLKRRQSIANISEKMLPEREKTEEIFKALTSLVKNLRPMSLISEDEVIKLAEYGVEEFYRASMGAEAIQEVISRLDLDKLAARLRRQAQESSGQRHIKATKRLRVVESFKKANIDPSWMILRVLPVLPPDLRPMVQLTGGRFATSDLNDLYRRVINRNNRLKHLIELGAPEIILRNEKRMLQEAVDSLIDAAQRATRRRRGHPLRSLSDMLRGKQGRFRQNLLGKRVDYSGRSVIVVGPELKLYQCGLPKEMALEMFKPFVLRELILRTICPNVKSAKNFLETRPAEVFDILDEITRDHPVLLNRAPTLHKLGIQAFYPVLIEGSAIRIHPCVCSGFNADFDGDQMAVHVPLSKKAKMEAINLMMPMQNLLKPADGSPISVPNKGMALGSFYLTSIEDEKKVNTAIFADENEAILAYQIKKIHLRQVIKVRINGTVIKTSVGRVLFNSVLPKELRFINKEVKAQDLKNIITHALNLYGREKVVKITDDVKDLGFWSETLSGGVSVSLFDNKIAPEKDEMIKKAETKVFKIEKNYQQGLITLEERRRLVNEVWIETTEKMADITWERLTKDNPVKIIIDSGGARASKDQLKQLAAMRGLVVDPLGKIVELPTKSNFRQGLSIFEYVTSIRGSRKGLTDSALKTADAGYLTRRLVDVSHDVIIRSRDCKTNEGLEIKRDDPKRKTPFDTRISTRVLAKRVVDPQTKKTLINKGELVNDQAIKLINKRKIKHVYVRSPLVCQARYGLCALCYGIDFSTRELVKIGTPVGVVAAQSIGEPGTQLTMRIRHAGGIVGLDVTQGLPRVEELFEARTPKTLSPIAEIKGRVIVSETPDGYKIRIIGKKGNSKGEREYLVPLTSRLRVKDGDLVAVGTQLTSGYLDVQEVLKIRGLSGAQRYLIDEIQKVYESQGIPIHDKHFEAIVRKMSDKVRIETVGDTNLLPGEIVERTKFEEENAKVLAAGGDPASAQVVILGITRAALYYTDSWLSAASFQETTNVLTDAAISGKEDKILGLKENVIIGRLIPTSPQRAKME